MCCRHGGWIFIVLFVVRTIVCYLLCEQLCVICCANNWSAFEVQSMFVGFTWVRMTYGNAAFIFTGHHLEVCLLLPNDILELCLSCSTHHKTLLGPELYFKQFIRFWILRQDIFVLPPKILSFCDCKIKGLKPMLPRTWITSFRGTKTGTQIAITPKLGWGYAALDTC